MCVVLLAAILAILVWFFVEAWIFASVEGNIWLISLLGSTTFVMLTSQGYCIWLVYANRYEIRQGLLRGTADDVNRESRSRPAGVTPENRASFLAVKFNYLNVFAPYRFNVKSKCDNFDGRDASSKEPNSSIEGYSLVSPKRAHTFIDANFPWNKDERIYPRPLPYQNAMFGHHRRTTTSFTVAMSESHSRHNSLLVSPENWTGIDTRSGGGMFDIEAATSTYTAPFSGYSSSDSASNAAPNNGIQTSGTSNSLHSGERSMVGAWEMSSTCAICLGEYEEGENTYLLPCLHVYHQECLESWISTHSSCPFCKSELNVKLPIPPMSQKLLEPMATIMLLPLRQIARMSYHADLRRRERRRALEMQHSSESRSQEQNQLNVIS